MTATTPRRVTAFVDGFNLYHAVDGLGADHLKWLDLVRLLTIFAGPTDQLSVKYFSAYATWKPDAYRRHRAYVQALERCGVDAIMGQFKQKDRRCRKCGDTWLAHEEKETDVNIGLHMLNLAHKSAYDVALLVSNDSDLAPVVRMVRAEYGGLIIRVLTPPNRHTSLELADAADGETRKIQRVHIERSLLPERIPARGSLPEVIRPLKYSPP
ncbi:MAG: NYN domain-containing protein [Myxococcales bacterium]|nr:NYN domain-containing protein [Myxococcales bacterium]